MSDDDLREVTAMLRNAGLDPLDRSTESEDRVERIMRAIPNPPRPLRVLLGVLVAFQAPIALGWLVNTDPFGLLGASADDVHLVRDGAFGLVILVAAAMTAWRPRWAVPSFTIASVALVAQLAAGFADSSISASGWNEAIHLLLLVTTLLIGSCGLRLAPLGPQRATARRATSSRTATAHGSDESGDVIQLDRSESRRPPR